jgi:hypothetical protein
VERERLWRVLDVLRPIAARHGVSVAQVALGWLLAQSHVTSVIIGAKNRDQLLDLVGAAPARWLEIVIHQHMPMFHMEHCVFCAVLSPGTNKTNCGRPCDMHDVRLRDRVGMEHPLTADVGCRNTLYNAVPQSAAEIVPILLERGIRHFRVELGVLLLEILQPFFSKLVGNENSHERARC